MSVHDTIARLKTALVKVCAERDENRYAHKSAEAKAHAETFSALARMTADRDRWKEAFEQECDAVNRSVNQTVIARDVADQLRDVVAQQRARAESAEADRDRLADEVEQLIEQIGACLIAAEGDDEKPPPVAGERWHSVLYDVTRALREDRDRLAERVEYLEADRDRLAAHWLAETKKAEAALAEMRERYALGFDYVTGEWCNHE